MKKLIFVALALALVACNSPMPVAPVAAAPSAPDNRPCAVIAKELEQVTSDMEKIRPAAEKAEAENKNLRESLMSKILVFQYLGYDAETPARFNAMKSRKEALELSLAGKTCQADKS